MEITTAIVMVSTLLFFCAMLVVKGRVLAKAMDKTDSDLFELKYKLRYYQEEVRNLRVELSDLKNYAKKLEEELAEV